MVKTAKVRQCDLSTVNFIRRLLTESEAYSWVANENIHYDCIVMLQPDMFIAKPILCTEIYNAINTSNSVYTCNFNDWNGYGTGFYIGQPDAMKRILGQKQYLSSFAEKLDGEKLLKYTFEQEKIQRVKSDMFHFKVRVGGKPNVYYQLLKKYTTPKQYIAAISLFKNISSNDSDKSSKDDSTLSNRKTKSHYKRRSCPT